MSGKNAVIFYWVLSVALTCLSAAFSYHIFKLIFRDMGGFVPLLAAILVAALMWGMSWHSSDEKRLAVWAIACVVSVLTTVLSVALGTISSGESERVVKVLWGAVQQRGDLVEEDKKAGEIWTSHKRVSRAAEQREIIAGNLDKSVAEAQAAAAISQGEALISIAMNKIPDGGGPFVVGILSLLLAVLLDLGAAACVKTVMEEREREKKREPPRKREKKVNRTKSSPNSGKQDTGVEPGANSRYKAFIEGVQGGDIEPNTESVKKSCSCGYTTARAYLDQGCKDGVLICDESGRGKRYSLPS